MAAHLRHRPHPRGRDRAPPRRPDTAPAGTDPGLVVGDKPLSREGFGVAFVCTGNRFRSPLAAALFARQTETLPVTAASFGTLDLGPVPVLPEAAAVARGYGIDLSAHRARHIEDLERFDLVVGFERMHVAAAVIDAGAQLERTFALSELVELLQSLDAPPSEEPLERARARVAEAHATRRPGYRTTMPEISDPLGQSDSAQRQIAEEVRTLVLRLAEQLFA